MNIRKENSIVLKIPLENYNIIMESYNPLLQLLS